VFSFFHERFLLSRRKYQFLKDQILFFFGISKNKILFKVSSFSSADQKSNKNGWKTILGETGWIAVYVYTRWDKPNNRFSFNLNENRRRRCDAMQCVVFSFLSELKEGKKDIGSDFNSFSQEIKKTIFCFSRILELENLKNTN
jgi:hypothetical protein